MNYGYERGISRPYPGKRRLVEECEKVSIGSVQTLFGKKMLIAAVQRAEPLSLPVLGGSFDLSFVDQPHLLPGAGNRFAYLRGESRRLWFQCPGCRKKAAKLYFFYLAPDSLAMSELLCRNCHGLVYQSQNCGGNRWYRETARPLKRLLKEKSVLLASCPGPRVEARLIEIDAEIRMLRHSVVRKTPRLNREFRYAPARRRRRKYRNLDLIEQSVVGIS